MTQIYININHATIRTDPPRLSISHLWKTAAKFGNLCLNYCRRENNRSKLEITQNLCFKLQPGTNFLGHIKSLQPVLFAGHGYQLSLRNKKNTHTVKHVYTAAYHRH